jgi:SAM-dependent methyltransferase
VQPKVKYDVAGVLLTLVSRPVLYTRALVAWLVKLIRHGIGGGYEAEDYWRRRHLRYGFDLRAVGNKRLSHEKNLEMYREAKKVFLGLCDDLAIDLSNARMLDIGCGTGFYAEAFRERGGSKYTGVDITDALFEGLRDRFPGYSFENLDITSEDLEGTYDLIIMIDVTQHITDRAGFARAMENVRRCLGESGVFIATSWLRGDIHTGLHEVSRSLESFREAFPGCRATEPRPFRDKFIFAIARESPSNMVPGESGTSGPTRKDRRPGKQGVHRGDQNPPRALDPRGGES